MPEAMPDPALDPTLDSMIGPSPASARSFGAIVKELSSTSAEMVRCEIRLARLEVADSVERMRTDVRRLAIFGGIAALGILPFVAFLVIGLGAWLDDNYWLSSLIVSLLCFSVGGGLAIRAYRQIREEDLTLSRTRDTISEQADQLGDRIRSIGEAATRRRAS